MAPFRRRSMQGTSYDVGRAKTQLFAATQLRRVCQRNFRRRGLGVEGALRLMGSLDRPLGAVHLRSGNDHNRCICHRLCLRSCILCSPFPLLILSKPNPRFRQIEGKGPVFRKPQLYRKAIAFFRSFAEFLAP